MTLQDLEQAEAILTASGLRVEAAKEAALTCQQLGEASGASATAVATNLLRAFAALGDGTEAV